MNPHPEQTINNFKLVAEKVQELYKKYGEYTHFDYTCGTESTKNNEFYEKWNIYTSVISHNTFSCATHLIEFIDKMIADGNDLYKNHRKNELLEQKKAVEEHLGIINLELDSLNLRD